MVHVILVRLNVGSKSANTSSSDTAPRELLAPRRLAGVTVDAAAVAPAPAPAPPEGAADAMVVVMGVAGLVSGVVCLFSVGVLGC